LPNLNDYTKAQRANRYAGAQMKKDAETKIGWYIMQQLNGVRITKPVWMHYRWIEPNERRDLDNISAFGRKVIQDALVSCGVLVGDGWKHIKGFSDEFSIDKQAPRIEITIDELHEWCPEAAKAAESDETAKQDK